MVKVGGRSLLSRGGMKAKFGPELQLRDYTTQKFFFHFFIGLNDA